MADTDNTDFGESGKMERGRDDTKPLKPFRQERGREPLPLFLFVQVATICFEHCKERHLVPDDIMERAELTLDDLAHLSNPARM